MTALLEKLSLGTADRHAPVSVVGNPSVPMVLDQKGKIALKRGVSRTDHRGVSRPRSEELSSRGEFDSSRSEAFRLSEEGEDIGNPLRDICRRHDLGLDYRSSVKVPQGEAPSIIP